MSCGPAFDCRTRDAKDHLPPFTSLALVGAQTRRAKTQTSGPKEAEQLGKFQFVKDQMNHRNGGPTRLYKACRVMSSVSESCYMTQTADLSKKSRRQCP
jgi:hypothetical protein